jgi:hypothetical protein
VLSVVPPFTYYVNAVSRKLRMTAYLYACQLFALPEWVQAIDLLLSLMVRELMHVLLPGLQSFRFMLGACRPARAQVHLHMGVLVSDAVTA